MRAKKFIVTAVCILLIASNFVTSAFADWYDDVKSGCTWVEIEGDDFVADTFCGVDALYNESDAYYQCNELIMRFYDEAFGLDVLAYSNTGLIMLSEGYGFIETQSPKKGDIIFVSAEMRDSATDHWAVVKSYGNGYITMFEQNVVWNGKAARNRQIKYPSDSYYIFTPVSLGDAPDPMLEGVEKETTTLPSTTKAETTVPSTTQRTITTEISSTTEKTYLTKAETSTVVSTTDAVITITAQAVESTIQDTATVAVSDTQTSTQNTDEGKPENGLLLPVTGVFAALSVIIIVAVIVLKKKK